jgi:hypothetical protein
VNDHDHHIITINDTTPKSNEPNSSTPPAHRHTPSKRKVDVMGRRKRSRQDKDEDNDLEGYERKWLVQRENGTKHQRVADGDAVDEHVGETSVSKKTKVSPTSNDDQTSSPVSAKTIAVFRMLDSNAYQ